MVGSEKPNDHATIPDRYVLGRFGAVGGCLCVHWFVGVSVGVCGGFVCAYPRNAISNAGLPMGWGWANGTKVARLEVQLLFCHVKRSRTSLKEWVNDYGP
jgi:hypothetical protein